MDYIQARNLILFVSIVRRLILSQPTPYQNNCQLNAQIFSAVSLLNIFNKNTMSRLDQSALSLIKYSPEEILFLKKQPQTIYRYYDLHQGIEMHPTISHEALLRGICFEKGVIYQKQQSNLEIEIRQRSRSYHKQYFSEEEVVNTFCPLFECLQHLHDEGVTHGSIHLQNIIVVDEEIKLRDWLAPTKYSIEYYQEQPKTKQLDFEALGKCFINCVILNTTNLDFPEIQHRLEHLIEKYSKHFIIALLIIVKLLKSYYKCVNSILEGESKFIDTYLFNLYDQIKRNKDKKKKSLQAVENGIIASPTKKFSISNGNKKIIHYENIENKIECGEGKKAQKITKIIEKSVLMHELMNKKFNEEQKKIKEETFRRTQTKNPIINVSNFGAENNNKKIGFRDTSPAQKIRTFSKKK